MFVNQKCSTNVILFFIYLVSIVSIVIKCDYQSIPQLDYYEIIDAIDIKHNKIAKRDTDFVDENHKESVNHLVSFRAINKEFNLLLNHNKDVISSQFNAFTIDAKGRKKPLFVDLNEFYSGKVNGVKDSDVRAHIGRNGIMTATIQTNSETYEVEPLWRHLPNHLNRDESMIVYKRSDVKHSSDSTDGSRKFCDYIKIDDNVTDDNIMVTEELIRRKRQSFYNEIAITGEINAQTFTPTHTHCAIVLVADHYFYQLMGDSNSKTTINYLIHIIDRVNRIFNGTEWTDIESGMGFTGMGFFIKEIQIHTEPTPDWDHYNSDQSKRSVRDVLEAFSLNRENSQFCLAHLFTHRSFEGSVLGLAYVASPRTNSVGGMCSPSYYGNTQLHPNGISLYLNTGLTTTRNTFGHRIITREAVLVTAHEFGHNWGSEHDPHTEECSPNAENGGSYIMYTYSVSGYEENNRFFSPCSKRSISAVLVGKSHRCFSRPDKSYCGNSKVEDDEECDEGLLVKGDDYATGLCCDSRCRLLPGSDCSDKNSDCCASCRVKHSGQVCKLKDELNCKNESYCDGESPHCPEPSPMPNNTKCMDRGQCRAGKCLSFCAAQGQSSCLCEGARDACFRCCRAVTIGSNFSSLSGTCAPVEPRDPLPNGTPCKYGVCEAQRCERAVQDFVERFWDVIEEIDINTFFRIMKDNIVGVVLVLSLIVWVPITCAISYYDQKHKEKVRRRSSSFDSVGSQRRNGNSVRPRSFNSTLSRPSVRYANNQRINTPTSSVYYPSTYGYRH